MFFTYDKNSNSFDLTLDPKHWLESAVITSLFAFKRTPESSIPSGWWANELGDVEVGSRLHLLKREKLTDETLELAREYSTDAIQWLSDQSLISDFQIFTEQRKDALILSLELIQPHEPRMVTHVFHLPDG